MATETRIPSTWKKTKAWVYSRSKKGGAIKNKKSQPIQGVWTSEFDGESPQEVWLFTHDNKPVSIQKHHKHGVWGYKPGVKSGDRSRPQNMWFYPPDAKIPSRFTPAGIWMFPLFLLGDQIEKLEPGNSGFIKVGDARGKDKKLDVGGQWNMIYKRDNLPMKINVKTPTGKKYTFDVTSDDTIESVKEKVEEKTQTRKTEQILSYKEVELEDEATLADYNISNGDTIHLEPMEIYVEDNNGRTFTLEVTQTDTITTIKEKIVKQEGIPKDYQLLAFNGTDLKDKKTLKDYDIINGDTLDLKPIEVQVKEPNGITFTVQVESTDTIETVKKEIYKRKRIPVDDQNLAFNDKDLKDEKTVQECKIKHRDTIVLKSNVINIKDTKTGKTFPIDVNPNDTIDTVMEKIEDKKGIPKSKQRLLYRKEELLRRRTLKQHNINNGDTVDLDMPMQVKVKEPNGKIHNVDVTEEDTVETLQEKIWEETGIPKDAQRLVYKKEVLIRRRTIKECKIKDGDIINLEPMQVQVKEPNGKTHSVTVSPDDTIDTVKSKIEEKTGISKDDQRIVCNGKDLKNNKKTLQDYNIQHGDMLQLQSTQITFRDKNGKTFTMDVNSDETVEEVMTRIEKERGIPKSEQRIVYKKEILVKRRTLYHYHIKHGDTLDLVPMDVPEEDIPSYQIEMTNWQNPMMAEYDPGQHVKQEGVRDKSNLYAYLYEGENAKKKPVKS